MRVFNFKARNIGEERYLTYTMGEECELDEQVLDYCEENNLSELVDIIYEEDDDFDYLTYDVTGKISLEDYIATEVNANKVLTVIKNIASNLISLKEQAINLSYILLNRSYIYINEQMELQYICLPIESDAAVAAEFKSFVRQLLANMKYDVDEDLNYVGKLLTYINGENFNLRGLIALSEALMEEAGIAFEKTSAIEADGVEVVNEEPVLESTPKVSEFMSDINEEEVLPEIGDDEEEDTEEAVKEEELESILPTGMVPVKEEAAAESTAPVKEEAPAEKTEEKPTLGGLQSKESDIDVIKSRIKELVGEVPTLKPTHESAPEIKTLDDLDNVLGKNKPPVIKKNVVKVNRAALIQSVAEHEGETEKLEGPDPVPTEPGEEKVEHTVEEPQSNSILSKTVEDTVAPRSSLLNAPKAMPYLIRVNTEERIMLGKVTFKIGKASRGVDYTVDGNGAISRQHAMIIQKDGVCYIKDNKSTNHTYVNDKMVEDGVEEILTHDSRIRLGDEEFVFKIR